MHSPKQTSILYIAPTDETGRLTPFCIALQKMFKDKGFMIDDRPLKLHATIVNTIYAKGRKRPPRSNAYESSSGNAKAKHQLGEVDPSTPDDRSQGHGPNANAPLKIDATAILEKYEDFVWAKDVVLDRVAICEMGAKKVVDEEGNVKDEEYTEVACIALPT
jgi:activating signal cointegrator complex subunit 1